MNRVSSESLFYDDLAYLDWEDCKQKYLTQEWLDNMARNLYNEEYVTEYDEAVKIWKQLQDSLILSFT